VLKSAQRTDNCKIAALFEQEILLYKSVSFSDAFAVSFAPKCDSWCAVGNFNYLSYEAQYRSLIPCAPTQEVFDQKLKALDILNQQSRDDFALCTGLVFSRRVPDPRQPFIYTSTRTFDSINSKVKETMKANIELSYSAAVEANLQKTEISRLNSEILRLEAEAKTYPTTTIS